MILRRVLKDNDLVLTTGLIMLIGLCKGSLKLSFRTDEGVTLETSVSETLYEVALKFITGFLLMSCTYTLIRKCCINFSKISARTISVPDSLRQIRAIMTRKLVCFFDPLLY